MERSEGRRPRGLLVRWAVLFAAVVAAGALASMAQASTLAGEMFFANDDTPGHEITTNCGPTLFGFITYHVEGDAAGPHSGTFVEDGEIFINTMGLITRWDATFRITSAAGNVTGEKHLLPEVPLRNGECFQGGEARLTTVLSALCYRAVFADGSSETGLTDAGLIDFFGRPVGIGVFRESEFTPNPMVSCGCPEDNDEDDDGLTDRNENRLFTLLGNSDSDLDGIPDGDDDANGNGEDDEDEDDDDEDGCPDEDSDGDGEDDEDENDEDDD